MILYLKYDYIYYNYYTNAPFCRLTSVINKINFYAIETSKKIVIDNCINKFDKF